MASDTRFSSRTAILAAIYRARASAASEPLCDDVWAAAFARGGASNAMAAMGDAAAPYMELGIGLRTAWLDAAVALFGGSQVVVLGAGLDSRAARLNRSNLRFYEVDHPGTQSEKVAAMSEIADYPVDGATLVPCDLESDDLGEALSAKGCSTAEPTLFLAEGLFAYLTEAVVHRVVSVVARYAPGSQLDFDHLAHIDEEVARVSRSLGEPMRFHVSDPTSIFTGTNVEPVIVATMAEVHAARARREPTPAQFAEWMLIRARVRA